MDERSECSSQFARSMTSALSFRSSTTARRTVHTLIGSKVALRTSTRPEDRGSMLGSGYRQGGRTRVGAQDADAVAVRVECADRLGHRRVVGAPLAVGEEQVVAELPARRPGLDLDEVDAAEGELRQAAHEPSGAVVARACEEDRRLETGAGI